MVSDSDRIDFFQLQFILLHQMVEKLSLMEQLELPSQLRVFVFQVIETVGAGGMVFFPLSGLGSVGIEFHPAHLFTLRRVAFLLCPSIRFMENADYPVVSIGKWPS